MGAWSDLAVVLLDYTQVVRNTQAWSQLGSDGLDGNSEREGILVLNIPLSDYSIDGRTSLRWALLW